MYVPKQFRIEDLDEVRNFISTNSFGILVVSGGGSIAATHIPFILFKNSHDQDVLLGHISRANPQLNNIDAGSEVLAIFQGSDAYVSSSWYDHENAPTWNYMAVHVYGKIRIVEGDELLRSLTLLVDKHEAASEHPVSVETMSKQFVSKEIKGIIGFEIAVTRTEGVKKLSQNRDAANYSNVISELEKKSDQKSTQIALEMRKLRE